MNKFNVRTGSTRLEASDHPVVKIWQTLNPSSIGPAGLDEIFDDESAAKKHKKKSKAALYRLKGIGPGGSNVIGKQSLLAPGRIERTIYQAVLPKLPISNLEFFGYSETEGDDYCWLFIEDAGDLILNSNLPEHRKSLAEWLAQMHFTAPELDESGDIQNRSTSYYLKLAETNIVCLAKNLTHPDATETHKRCLQSLLSSLEIIKSHWNEVSEICNTVPSTLVHGAVLPRNIRVRQRESDIEILAFDWEHSGFGTMAADLYLFLRSWRGNRLNDYFSAAREYKSVLTFEDLVRLTQVGCLLRHIQMIEWVAPWLSADWFSSPMKKLTCYSAPLVNVIRELGWEQG